MSQKPLNSPLGFSIGGRADLRFGTVNPSLGVGVGAPVPSLYFRLNGGTIGELWLKTGSADTAWALGISSSGSSEDPSQNTFMGKAATGASAPNYPSASQVTQGSSLVAAVGALDASIGAPVSGQQSRTKGPVSAQPVNSNVLALDAALGADFTPKSRTISPLAMTQAVLQMIANLDSAVGADSDLSSTNYVALANNIFKNLAALDTRVKANTDAISGLSVGIAWITKVKIVTATDISAFSGTSVTFTDVDGRIIPVVAGDRVVSTNAASDADVYVVAAGAWTKIPLVNNDTFFADYDLTAPVNAEGIAAYYHKSSASAGSRNVLLQRFTIASADLVALGSNYAPALGTIVSSDTVQAAISKLDNATAALVSLSGVNRGASTLGASAGSVVPANSTIKAALNALDSEASSKVTLIGVAAGATDLGSFTGSTVPDGQTVKGALQVMETAFEEVYAKASGTLTAGVAAVVDSIALTNLWEVEWSIAVQDGANVANRYGSKVFALVSTTDVDYTEFAVLNLGTSPTVTVAVIIDSGYARLQVTSSVAAVVKVGRRALISA